LPVAVTTKGHQFAANPGRVQLPQIQGCGPGSSRRAKPGFVITLGSMTNIARKTPAPRHNPPVFPQLPETKTAGKDFVRDRRDD
jgi:hypothetical protein